jgi:hypothetical protein
MRRLRETRAAQRAHIRFARDHPLEEVNKGLVFDWLCIRNSE